MACQLKRRTLQNIEKYSVGFVKVSIHKSLEMFASMELHGSVGNERIILNGEKMSALLATMNLSKSL